MFQRRVRVSTSDADSAIAKAERCVEGCHVVRVLSHIHHASVVIGRASRFLKDEHSAMVQLTLTLAQPGAMAGFRRALRHVINRGLVIRHGLPSRECKRHTSTSLDLLFKGCAPYSNVRRSVIEALANGDWQRNDVIEHWTTKVCTRAEIVRRFVRVFVWSVASAAPLVYPRHRWTGAEQTMLWVLVLQACHGLLARVYGAWLRNNHDFINK